MAKKAWKYVILTYFCNEQYILYILLEDIGA